jgi:hypothetical protein
MLPLLKLLTQLYTEDLRYFWKHWKNCPAIRTGGRGLAHSIHCNKLEARQVFF